MKKKSTKIPEHMKEKYQSITELTTSFSKEKLNDEYAELACQVVAALCRKRPSPVVSGSEKVWACAVVHALGIINFLSDKSTKPYCNNADLIAWFGVGQSTVSGKSKQIREMLGMNRMASQWILPSRYEDSLMLWMVSVNGYIVDIRTMPLEIQMIAFQKGIIPYVPDLRDQLSET